VAAAVVTEVEAFLTLARTRLASEGWCASDWVETGLRTALLHDGRRLLENLFNDPTLPLAADQSGPGEKCTPAVEREIETLFGALINPSRTEPRKIQFPISPWARPRRSETKAPHPPASPDRPSADPSGGRTDHCQ